MAMMASRAQPLPPLPEGAVETARLTGMTAAAGDGNPPPLVILNGIAIPG